MKEVTRKHEVLVPAGKYFLGDPCYSVPSHLWMDLLSSAEFFYTNPIGTVSTPAGTFSVLAFGTAYGDGLYRGRDGYSYPVDAGLIGLTPVELIDANTTAMKADGQLRTDLGKIIEFGRDIVCSGEGGIMDFGDYHIDTKNEDEDEEDSCLDCGSEGDQCHDSQCSSCCDACTDEEEY